MTNAHSDDSGYERIETMTPEQLDEVRREIAELLYEWSLLDLQNDALGG